MTALSITMMVIAMVLVWGGLLVAVRFLLSHPVTDGPDDEAPGAGAAAGADAAPDDEGGEAKADGPEQAPPS